VEYKTDWVADLQDLPAFFAKDQRNMNERQSIEGLEQVYGYMTFNANKYGILSNWTRTWFLRHVESVARKTLECAGPIELAGSPGTPSMLKAFVGMVLLAERDWFYTSPTLDTPPPAHFFGPTKMALKQQKKAISIAGNYEVVPFCGSYLLLMLDFRLCDFELSAGRHSGFGCVVRTKLAWDVFNQAPLEVICKVADIIHSPDACTALQDESKIYAALRNLQGIVIPTLYGPYNVRLLQGVGNPAYACFGTCWRRHFGGPRDLQNTPQKDESSTWSHTFCWVYTQRHCMAQLL
jgi:hypothetical protein